MYITAQHVVSPSGKDAINAFLHMHPADDPAHLGATTIGDVEMVAEATPGTLVDQRTGLPPGGNRVVSYVDIVAPNDVGVDAIAKAVHTAAKDYIHTHRWSDVILSTNIAMRFTLQPGLSRQKGTELDRLIEQALQLLREYRSKQVKSG